MPEIINNCQLEIDHARGVLYVHTPDGYTILRICRLTGLTHGTLDITLNKDNRYGIQLSPRPAAP